MKSRELLFAKYSCLHQFIKILRCYKIHLKAFEFVTEGFNSVNILIHKKTFLLVVQITCLKLPINLNSIKLRGPSTKFETSIKLRKLVFPVFCSKQQDIFNIRLILKRNPNETLPLFHIVLSRNIVKTSVKITKN